MSAKRLLLNWINACLPTCHITNFHTDWNNGVNLSALVDYCKPGLVPSHASLDPSESLQNITHAMELADKELNVPPLIRPEDLAAEKPDELSVLTYISGFCGPDSPGHNSLIDWVNSKLSNQFVSNFTTDWVDGRVLATLVHILTFGGFPEAEQMKAEDELKNCQDAMEAAENLLAIRQTVSPEEFSQCDLGHLQRLAYLTQFRFVELPNRKSQQLH